MKRFPWWLLALLLAAAGFACAIEVHHLAADEKISLDGKLDEPAWQRAPVLDRFWELSPQDKIEAKVRTEARFAYDRQALYVAIRAFDPDMSKIRAPFARRDNVLSDQDMIVVNVDPVGNRKFAHFFRVNPRGSIGDGLYNEDTSNEDFSPDIEFEVVTGVFDGGWTAEFRIPFASLRYTDPPSRRWSVMIYRVWPRDQQYRMSSSMLPRDQTCFLCLNEPLTGLDELPAARHLELTPNITLRGTATRTAADAPIQREHDVVPSVDMKWRPRADIVVDATINPDFSQVELDAPQLAGNTQFALFFPEKRPFFLEGADILQSPFQAIYTRSVTDPAWGARATQRAERFDATVLVTRDEGGGLVLLPNTYGTGIALQDFKSTASFARGRWQVGHGVTVSGLFTDRTLDGGAYNRVAGPDVVWFPDTANRFRLQALGSWTTAQPVNGTLVKGELASSHAVFGDWGFHNNEWDLYADLEDVGKSFRADNGFIVQNGYRRIYTETNRKFLNRWGLNEVTPYFNFERKVAVDGGVVYGQQYIGVKFGLPRGTLAWIEGRPNSLVAVQPGAPRKRDQISVGFDSNPFPWLAKIHVEYTYGDRLDVANNRIGRGYVYNVQLNLRPHPRAELEYRIDNDIIDSREPADNSPLIIGQRAQQLIAYWHFTARDNIRAIWQGSGIRRGPSLWPQPIPARENSQRMSLVYGHREGIGRTFYVGVNFGRDRITDAGLHTDRVEVFTKASWTFDVL